MAYLDDANCAEMVSNIVFSCVWTHAAHENCVFLSDHVTTAATVTTS